MKHILLWTSLGAIAITLIATVFSWYCDIALLPFSLSKNEAWSYKQLLRNGDIIFHTSLSQQSNAIQEATQSPYSHCGVIYNKEGNLMVFEAVQPVKVTPLATWVQRGEHGHFVVKRLHNAEQVLTPTVLQHMQKLGEQWMGKPYDPSFEWSDKAVYCSELVWKLYKRAAEVELCPVQRLRSFDLTSKRVQHLMKQRYGDIFPLDEPVVSPVDIFDSEQLVVVYEQ